MLYMAHSTKFHRSQPKKIETPPKSQQVTTLLPDNGFPELSIFYYQHNLPQADNGHP